MMRTRWRKVLSDLWKNRARTLVVALAVAMGVYAVGVVLNTRELLLREYAGGMDRARMAAAVVYTMPFDEKLAERIAELPGIESAEGRQPLDTWVYDSNGERRNLLLTAIPDFGAMQVDAILPLAGQAAPGKREVILEWQAFEYLGLEMGDSVIVELEDGTEKELTVVGSAHDPQQMSPDVTGRTTGYITLETLGTLGIDESYTELHLRVSEGADDKAHINAIVDEVEDHLERTGRPVLGRQTITEPYATPFINSIVFILSTFGLIILLLSGFLVINAISALIAQQVPQIGIMKLIGARRGQIMGLYMVTVLVYGLLAIALGLPAAVLTAQALMSRFIEPLLNVMSVSYSIPVGLIALEVAIGLFLPFLAGLVPVLKGTRITTQQALNDVGVASSAQSQGPVERLLAALQRVVSLSRSALLVIRNTLRHKGRLAQTLLVLIFGTALLIAVISVWSSVNATVDSFMRYHRYDVSLELERPYRLTRIEQAALAVPGVVDVEGWSRGSAVRQRPDGSESNGLAVYAVPPETHLMTPEPLAGVWLDEAGPGTIIVNSDVLDDEPDIELGSTVELEIGGRETTWRVAGIVPTESMGPAIYMNLDDYAHTTRTPNQANRVQVVTSQHDGPSQQIMEKTLFKQFQDLGFQVTDSHTTEVIREENELMFVIIVAILVLMALLLAAVGGLGLTTTMSINILERVREIGVLRAVGASNVAVRWIVLAEGMVIGLLSWIVGTLLSYPISILMSRQLGLALINIPLNFHYSLLTAALWFFVLQAVAIVASLGPARGAVRLTVREVLAYE